MQGYLNLYDPTRAEPAVSYRVTASSVMAMANSAARLHAEHVRSRAHRCTLTRYTVMTKHARTGLARIVAAGTVADEQPNSANVALIVRTPAVRTPLQGVDDTNPTT